MNYRAILAIVRKDLKVVSQNKNIIIPLCIIIAVFFIVLPWLIGLIPTVLPGLEGKLTSLEGVLAYMPDSVQQGMAGYSILQKVIVYILVYMFLPFFLLLPIMVASMIAADSIAGEKERKTLEALLYTPTTDRELLIAKMLSGWLASIVAGTGGFVLYAINVNAAAWPVVLPPSRNFLPQDRTQLRLVTPWKALVQSPEPALRLSRRRSSAVTRDDGQFRSDFAPMP